VVRTAPAGAHPPLHLDRLRKEIEPVCAADFMRFLFRWQRLTDETRAEGPEGLTAVLDLLDGFELPAGAWESDVLPARVADYDPLWLDGLCLSGEIGWGRLSPAAPPAGNGAHKTGPIRYAAGTVPAGTGSNLARDPSGARSRGTVLSHSARALFEALEGAGVVLRRSGERDGLLRTEVEKGLGELVAWGSWCRTALRVAGAAVPSDAGGRRAAAARPDGTVRGRDGALVARR
jgi:ATP-dependent Lhr-like helicase